MEEMYIRKGDEFWPREIVNHEIRFRSLLSYLIKKWRTVSVLVVGFLVLGVLISGIPNYGKFVQAKETDMQVANAEEAQTAETQVKYTLGDAIAETSKMAAIVAFAGLFAAAMGLGAQYVLSDKILDTDKLLGVPFLNVLGAIPQKSVGKVRGLDRLAAHITRISRRRDNYDAHAKLTALSINATACAQGIQDGDIALVGSITMEELTEIAHVFNEAIAGMGNQYAAAGNPMRDVVSIHAITASRAVVIIEKQGTSLLSDVFNECARIHAWGKPILGIVLLHADAV